MSESNPQRFSMKEAKILTIVDLVLHASSLCQFCRQGQRPRDESDQEHGNQFTHAPGGTKCGADQVWVLIRQLERGA